MARSFGSGVSLVGPGANTSGLNFSRLNSLSPPQLGAGLGVDVAGNVIVTSGAWQSVMLSSVANPANSTADFNAVQTTIPANGLWAGAIIQGGISGTVTANASLASTTYNFWVKLGNTKILPTYFNVALLSTASGTFMFDLLITVRSTGTGGTFAGCAVVRNGATGSVALNNVVGNIDTTAAQTLSMGFNWSNGGTNNIITATQGVITPF